MSNLIILIFFLIAYTSFSSSLHTTHKCSVQQTHNLLLFKQNLSSINFSFNGFYSDDSELNPCEDQLGSAYNPIMMNWNASTDCCDWNGVTCDHSTGDVIGLDLSCGMLKGTIHPNTTLFRFPHLQRLNLAYNNLSGSQLPPEIGRLSNSLTHLNISYCGFKGQVPTNISHLHKLVSLDLSSIDTDLNLEPHVFFNMLQNYTVMEELSLALVNISSVLPSNLNISSSLRLLNLLSAGFKGNLPHNIFKLQSLEELHLSFNSFTGYIPSEISLLPKLVSLDLSWNGLDNLLIQSHVFSILIQNSTCLRDLQLGEVNIGLVLPTYLNISFHLRELQLSSTNLQGKLPENILNLAYLETLDLSGNNKLSGPLPKVNTSTRNPLQSLYLSDTSLSGEIPTSIGHLNSLVYLDLSNCGLNGSLAEAVGNLKQLVFLDLSSNMLSGTLPSSFFTLPSLEIIVLDNNQLTGKIDVLNHGPIPQTFQKLTNLTILDLSYNNFRGDWELDTLLSSLTNLEALTLSHSGISVTTSDANHYVNHDLNVLSLVSCGLKEFPMSLQTMKVLRFLDLSSNDIHGHIPDWVGEIGGNQLLTFNISNNSISGTIPNVYEGWGGLEGFILNVNKLEGKLPTSLHKCQNLKVIDLGNNHLNDTFPSWLEDLPQLQVLILRSNSFHGGIITSSTVKFPFQSLRVLDLSHNGFVGQLPTKYFQNFNAMMNVVKKNTKPTYVSTEGLYYTIIVAMKGMYRDFPQLLAEYTIIDLSYNKFEGEIPNILENLNSLKALNLSHNSLTGQIPQGIRKIMEIESLDLSWNQLKGEIPQSLVDLTSLETLNLSVNHLIGRIPQGKQFNTFEANSFGGNLKLCGLPLPKKCSGRLLKHKVEGDGDGENDDESGFTWRVVMIGYGWGTLLGFMFGYLMLSTGRPEWFNSIANAAECMILRSQKKRRYV